MRTTTTIPDAVYEALKNGNRRNKIKRDFNLSEETARFYCKLFEQSLSEPWKRALVLADLHIPYHSESAVTAILKWAESQTFDQLILLGDFVDFYKVSHWIQDPNRMRFVDEIVEAKRILSLFRACFHKIVYIEGNHEERLKKYIWQKSPELYGLESLAVPKLLELGEIEYISTTERLAKQQLPYSLGNLFLLHGHEIKFSWGAVNIARSYYLKLNRSILFGHCHQAQRYQKRVLGGYDYSYAVGCLCDLYASFLPINNWNHGFAVVKYKNSGHFQVEEKFFQNGEIV